MNNKKMALDYINQAKIRLNAAKSALKDKHYPFCIRESQECVEFSLKAALRLVGIEPPKWHDVSIILMRNKQKFPRWFRELIEEFKTISRELGRERIPSMYGDEDLGLPPSEIYTKFDAEKACKNAEKVFKACKKLIGPHDFL